MSWPWSQLGLPGPSGLPEVRRAYAEKLKITHPEEDPEGFQRLHSAYQLASRMARQKRREEERPSQPEEERPAPEPSHTQEGFDFGKLLSSGEEDLRRSHEEEADFDFDELLREDETPPRPAQEEERDFDFDRLFAEGEAERADARRRRAEQRRRAQAQAEAWKRERQKAQEWTRKREQWQREGQRNTYEQNQRVRCDQEQLRWQNTETVLHTIDMLYNARADREVWEKFFQSELFQQTKGSLDLIFGLEDFVSSRSLSQEARLALFLAYSFDKGVFRPELRPLYQMLLPAWRAARREKDRERNLAVLGVILGLVFPFILVPLLDFGLIPAFVVSLSMVWVVWVIRKAVKTGNLEKQARGVKVSKEQERRAVFYGILAAAALFLVMALPNLNLAERLEKLVPARDPREQVCRYIEQDFGVKVDSQYNMSESYATDAYDNVFYLEDHPNRKFLAGPDGERDIKNGKPGYTTNLPEMMLLWTLKDFAFQWKIYDVDSLDQNMEHWETAGIFLISLPERGGEDILDGLGELLEEVRQEKWYKALTPQCQIVLCSRKMREGRIVLIRVHPATELYSVSQARRLYEEGFAHSVYAQLLRELELDRDFLHDGEVPYTLTSGGMAEIKGEECCKLYGLDSESNVACEYYVNEKGTAVYCVPGDFWETGGTEEQISFYRLLHWKDVDNNPLGIVNLYYPWLIPNY